MCLIGIAWRAHPRYPLVIAANRDEFHRRPALPAGFWMDAPQAVGGRDLEAGGAWLAMDTAGRFAAVTNYRAAAPGRGARSRGALVADYLRGSAAARDWARQAHAEGAHYGGFSLLAGDDEELWFCSNRDGAPRPVAPGIHGLSNHLLDTPWPKVERIQEALARALEGAPPLDESALLAALADPSPAPDERLPTSGDRARERALSAVFIRGADYGTRASTVVVVDADGRVVFRERRFAADGAPTGDSRHTFALAPPAA